MIKTYKLDNGIRVAEVPLPGLHSVTIEVLARIGAEYENKDEFGMSHFLEHMAFKGTEKRPTPQIINNEIDSKGANYNAGTGLEDTSYYITTAGDNLEWAVEILADILTNSKYDNLEIVKERGVIIEEIKMYQDNPMMGLSGDFMEFALGKSPLGCFNVSGGVGDIINTDRKKILSFRNKFWNTNNLVIVVAGDIKKDARKLCEKYFSKAASSVSQPLPKLKVVWNEQRLQSKQKDVEQAHFIIGAPAVSRKDKRKYAFKLMDIILSGNTSSRLFSKIREERGWAYYVTTISDNMEHTGIWGVQSGVQMSKLQEAMNLTESEILNLPATINDDELKRAKDFYLGKIRLMEDRTEFWSSFVGSRMLLDNEPADVEEELAKVKKVSVEDIKNLADEIFKGDKLYKMSVSRYF